MAGPGARSQRKRGHTWGPGAAVRRYTTRRRKTISEVTEEGCGTSPGPSRHPAVTNAVASGIPVDSSSFTETGCRRLKNCSDRPATTRHAGIFSPCKAKSGAGTLLNSGGAALTHTPGRLKPEYDLIHQLVEDPASIPILRRISRRRWTRFNRVEFLTRRLEGLAERVNAHETRVICLLHCILLNQERECS